MRLSAEDFVAVIDRTPLVSIDLLVRDPESGLRLLVGWRTQRPARDAWFVPGGRIYKGERVAVAFERITRAELGVSVSLDQATLVGVYDHLYDDNALEAPGVTTHYVVLGHALALPARALALPREQHTRYQWLTPRALEATPDVHPNTRAYLPALAALDARTVPPVRTGP